jgi:hypothetical protein
MRKAAARRRGATRSEQRVVIGWGYVKLKKRTPHTRLIDVLLLTCFTIYSTVMNPWPAFKNVLYSET